MKIIISLLMVLTLFTSCRTKNDPESVLRSFVNLRFDGPGAREKIIKLTTGDLRELLEELKGEESKRFWDLDKHKKGNFKINIKNCQEKVCYYTYTMSYKQQSQNPESDYDIETKKIAKIEMVDKKWLISDVSEVKTFIDSKVELK